MINILILNNNPDMIFKLSSWLANYNVFAEKNISAAKNIISAKKIDLVILGYQLTDGDGLKFCLYLSKKYPRIIKLFITSNQEARYLIGLDNGDIYGFLIAPFDKILFLAQIKSAVRFYKKMCRFNNLASLDALTNIYNRRIFEYKMRKFLKKNKPFFILYLDVDDFKKINDNFSHNIGDRILVQIANRLRGCFRKSDAMLSRFGGDEFVIMINNIKNNTILSTILSRVVKTFAQPFSIGSVSVPIHISVGAAKYPDNGGTVEELLAYADRNMYAVKKENKGRCYR